MVSRLRLQLYSLIQIEVQTKQPLGVSRMALTLEILGSQTHKS